MKKLIYLPVCLGMLFFSAACENWFDVSPKSDVKAEDLFQQESGFRDVLTGVYSLMSAPESYGRQLSFGYVDVLAQYYNISGNKMCIRDRVGRNPSGGGRGRRFAHE